MLTLAVNLAMMAIAFYAMLLYQELTTIDWVQQGWRAPALDLRLLLPIGLTLVQLTLVTAVALFFSTFSSPLLAMLFTLGVWVAGQFSADLRDFGTAVDSPAARRSPRPCTTCCRTSRPSTSRTRSCTGWPSPGRRWAPAVAGAAVYIALVLTAASAVFARRDFK